MFTERFEVRAIGLADIDYRLVTGVNGLLKKQYSGSKPITEEHLAECIHRMRVVVALNDNSQVVGLGVLTQSGGLNFRCAQVRHLIIANDSVKLALGMRVVQCLLEHLPAVEYVESVWVQDEEIGKIFTTLGFHLHKGSQYRYRP